MAARWGGCWQSYTQDKGLLSARIKRMKNLVEELRHPGMVARCVRAVAGDVQLTTLQGFMKSRRASSTMAARCNAFLQCCSASPLCSALMQQDSAPLCSATVPLLQCCSAALSCCAVLQRCYEALLCSTKVHSFAALDAAGVWHQNLPAQCSLHKAGDVQPTLELLPGWSSGQQQQHHC
eukprot:1158671-Pelagomonas_calceolata.AAC.1